MIFFYYFIDFQKLKMLFEIKEPIFQATVLKRPSQYCKTPYVADVYINGTSEMAHTPSLGCCGLADKEANVIVKKVDNEKSKCPYKIMLSQIYEKGENIIIGIDPKLAEELTLNAIQQNYFTNLQNIKNLHREKTFMNSRFDFCGIDQNDIPFILEVKNVPLADYIDASAKDKKNLDFSNKKINDKIAYFPDGYRKKKNDVPDEDAYVYKGRETLIATGEAGAKPSIYVWESETMERLAKLKGFHRRGVTNLEFSRNGEMLATVGADSSHSLAVYDWQKEKLVATMDLSDNKIFSITYMPGNPNMIVSAGYKHFCFCHFTACSASISFG